MKYLYIILLFFIYIQDSSLQTIINSITFEGNDYFTSNNLSGAMVSKKNGIFNKPQFELDLKSIRDRYREAGFLQVKIISFKLDFDKDSLIVDISIKISEGERITVGRILLSGNYVISDKQILEIFETKAGKVLDGNTLNNDIKSMLELYESKGYPFVKAEVRNISFYSEGRQQKIELQIDISEQAEVKIDRIKIKGNEVTKDYVIQREIKIEKDKRITRESLQQTKERLERLNIFEKVEDLKVYIIKNNNATGLVIEVVEGNTNTFDGIIGYVPPPSEKEKGYLTGLINLSFRNLFGTARRIDARWQQEVKSTQELEFKYKEPYFFGLPLNINTGFMQRIQDTTYTRRKVDLKGDIILSDKFTLSFLTGYDRVIPSEDTTRIFRIADSRIILTGFELRYDSRDYIYNPTKGLVYKIGYSYGDKKIFNIEKLQMYGYRENFSVMKYSSELEIYFSPIKRQTNLLRFFGGEARSDKLEDADFFRIGGNRNIRGYRDEQFLASKLLYANIEPRYSLGRRSFVSIFFDFGYYYRPFDDVNLIPKQEGFLYGFGTGIRLETALGIIGVSYALGKGDSFLDGKIHFGLINDF